MNIGQIVAEITATTTGLKKAQLDANKQFGQIQNEANATSAVVKTAFAVAGTAAVLSFVAALAKATDGANETRKAMMGLESTAKAFGQNFEDANKSVKELYSDGLMPLDKSIRGFKNLLSVGFSVDEAMQLSKSLKNIGAFNNVVGDLGQAYEDSTKGLKTGSMELIENIGLTQRLSTVMKNANVDISNGIDITNNAAQRRAVYNSILAEGAKFEGNAAKLANDNAAASAKMSAAIKNLSDEIGNRANPYFSSFLGIITNVANATAEWVKETNFDKVTAEIEQQKIATYGLSESYLDLKSKSYLSNEEQQRLSDIIVELNKMYPDYLKNIDLQNIKFSDAKGLMEDLNNELERQIINKQTAALVEDQTEKIVKSIKKEMKAREDLSIAKGELALQEKIASKASGIALYNATNNIEMRRDEIKALEKQIENSKNYRKELNAEIKSIREKGQAMLEMSESYKKKYYKNPQGTEFNTYNPDAEKFVPAKSGNKDKKEFRANMSKTLAQKKAELEYKKQVELANAKEEEKYLIELKYKTASAVLDAEDKYNKAIAGAKNQKTAKKAMDELISSVGKLELDLKIKEKSINYAKNALGLTNLEAYGISVPIEMDGMQEAVNTMIKEYDASINDMATEFLNKLKGANSAVGLTDVSNYGVTPRTRDDDLKDEARAKANTEETEQAFKDLDAALKNMVDVIDNDVIKALYSLGEGGKSFINSFKGFQAGQSEGGLLGGLGMLTGGIGMFTSAVSIFQTVGGLFHKSTYNFEEAVQKMLKGIGEKAPELQVAEFNKAVDYKKIEEIFSSIPFRPDYPASYNDRMKQMFTKAIEAAGLSKRFEEYKADGSIKAAELIANLEKIIPQLAEQLGTSAKDFGSDIANALSNAETFTDFSANLEDNVYSSVKGGLIAAFLASETMKPLLDKLQQSMTIAVADYTLTSTELEDLKLQVKGIEEISKPFYDALKAVGLDVLDASNSLADATDNFSSTMNRNLKLAERISKDSLGNSQIINIDLAGANLGGMSEANMINSLNKAVAMSNITKVGVR